MTSLRTQECEIMCYSCPSHTGKDVQVLCQPQGCLCWLSPVLPSGAGSPGRAEGWAVLLFLLLPDGIVWPKCLCPKWCFGTSAAQNWCGHQEHNWLSFAPTCSSSGLAPMASWQIPRIWSDSYSNIY